MASDKTTILVIEDEEPLTRFLRATLRSQDYRVIDAATGEAGLRSAAAERPDLILLDLGLPDVDGVEVTRRLRQGSDVPILMLTARSSEADKVLGLEIGADDYLTKPFGTSELVARVRALMRRVAPAASRERVLAFGPLRIDPARREAERDGARVRLTTLEFDLLYFLASRPGHVFSRESLMTQVWGDDRIVGDRSIDSLVSRLRRKLEADPDQPRWLQTVWGAGYRFADE